MEADIAIPIFFREPVQNSFKTEQEGRPVFDEHDFVRILIPGQKDVVARKVRPEDKQRWPEQYRRFVEGDKSGYVSGTPLSEWNGITRIQLAACKALNCHSVEALAALSEQALEKLGPNNHALQASAKKYLSHESDSDVKIKDLTEKLDAAVKRIAELEKPSDKPIEKVETGAPNVITHPDGRTWSGKGRKPQWAKDLEA